MISLIKYIAKTRKKILQSDLCDYSDAYIVLKGTLYYIVVDDAYDKKLAFKNNASFVSCISKVNNILIDNAKDLDIVMPIYNLIEYSKNYSKTSGGLWNYYRDEPNSGLDGANNNLNYSIKDSKSFDYKTSITGKLEDDDVEEEDVEIVLPLKYISNFWRFLHMPLINCEVYLTLTLSENCVITNKATREANADANPAIIGINNPTSATFKITDTKLYVPVVTL